MAVIKKIQPGKAYDFEIMQRLVGHLNFLLLFTREHISLLIPMYRTISQKCNFVFSHTYKILLKKMLNQRVKIELVHKLSVSIPRVATDATTPDVGAISRITGG